MNLPFLPECLYQHHTVQVYIIPNLLTWYTTQHCLGQKDTKEMPQWAPDQEIDWSLPCTFITQKQLV